MNTILLGYEQILKFVYYDLHDCHNWSLTTKIRDKIMLPFSHLVQFVLLLYTLRRAVTNLRPTTYNKGYTS